jgi:hypothetical protein
MKTLTTLTCIFAAALALISNQAAAAGTNEQSCLVENASLTVDLYKTNIEKGPIAVASTLSFSLKQKDIFNLLSNAIANVQYKALPQTNLPANGYIVYNSIGDDLGPETGLGFFYVTNKSGFYLPLSGFDTNTNYYSYMELDARVPNYFNQDGYLGFCGTDGEDFNEVGTYTFNFQAGTGPTAGTAAALFYVHDNPYEYDEEEHPDRFDQNLVAAEIHGVIKFSVSFKVNAVTGGSAAISGTGNFIQPGGRNGQGVITSGSVKLQ